MHLPKVDGAVAQHVRVPYAGYASRVQQGEATSKVDGAVAQHVRVPYAGYASRVQQGEATFGKYPENLLHSRVRYSKAFKVWTNLPSA